MLIRFGMVQYAGYFLHYGAVKFTSGGFAA
jgi:hypothetical protein